MPFDTNELPNLQNKRDERDVYERILGNNQLAEIIRKRKLVGEIGPVDYSIGARKAEFGTSIGNAMAKAIFDYEGNRKFELTSPLLGGNVNFSVDDPDNQRARFLLNYRRQF